MSGIVVCGLFFSVVCRLFFSVAGVACRGYNRGVRDFACPTWPGNVPRPAGRNLVPVRLRYNTAEVHMTPIEIVGALFGISAVVLIILLIYKSTLTMHEDDQLFLDEANSHLQEEQTELLTKVNRLTLPMRISSISTGVFLLAFVALLIYQKLNEVQ
jgi:hypothetical protein